MYLFRKQKRKYFCFKFVTKNIFEISSDEEAERFCIYVAIQNIYEECQIAKVYENSL